MQGGKGSLTVTDEVRFDRPESFGTALITFSSWKKLAPNRLQIGSGAGAVIVEIDTNGAAFEIKAQSIEEDLSVKKTPTRLAIELAELVTSATIRVTVVPVKN